MIEQIPFVCVRLINRGLIKLLASFENEIPLEERSENLRMKLI